MFPLKMVVSLLCVVILPGCLDVNKFLSSLGGSGSEEKDTAAAVISASSPSGVLSSGTRSIEVRFSTDEAASCKYSTLPNVSFSSMVRSFTTTGARTHSVRVAGLSEGESYDYYVRCEDTNDNVNDSDYQISFSVEKPLDATAPVLSGGSPNQNQSSATTAVDLGVITNENATCRYSSSQGVSFSSMTRRFAMTGATTHSVTIVGLSEGESYDYYVRCEDASNNVNDSDYQISFLVEKALDVTAPVLGGGSPNQDQLSTTTTVDLGVTTNENATCRYSSSPGMSYADMPSIFDSTGQTIHTTEVTGLIAENAYVYYVRCADTSTNANSMDYPISFSVLNAVAQDTPWSYVAIPYTDWAYNPFTIQPALPTEWPSSPALNYYYVEPNHPNASDTAQGDELSGTFGRFGYPNRPRISIPSNSWIGDVFAAGTVIWLKGGTYTDSNFRRTWSPQFHGTADAPVWLYGDPTDRPIFSGLRIQLFNSRHAIFDNLQWIGNNRSNSVLTLTRDRAGPTHHITLRNLRFENLNWRGGGGAIVGLTSSNHDGATLSDIVAYKNIFKNNGGGFDWSTKDNDHHGYKVDGRLAGNKTFRIWIIENQALKGDTPDPIDGLYKSLSGNLIQVGDQRSTSGGVHHVYAAGNYQEFARQALGWTKRSHDVIYSSNHCTDTYNLQGGNGQCFGHQYDGDHNWWINNTATNSAAGWMHTSNDATDGRFFIIGNIFHGNKKSDRNDNWRTCAGVSLYNQRGIHYFVNNVFDNNCYGIWARTNRHTSTSEMHIYNNIFTDFNAVTDTRKKAIDLEDSRGIQIFLENNLFGTYAGDVSLNGRALSTIQDLNDTAWAAGNLQGDPLYIDKANKNYNISDSSPAIDAGTQVYSGGAADVYQQFLDRYTNDINYPGDPAEYWPKDYLKQSRIVGGRIDIGPHERQ